MENGSANLTSSWVPPWGENLDGFFAAIAAHIPFDSLAIGALHAQRPMPDELLAVSGLGDAELARWFDNGFNQDAQTKTAMRTGLAIAPPDRPAGDSSLAPHQHVMIHMSVESLTQRTWWWFLLGRKSHAFTEAEQRLAALMLRHWQSGFCHPSELGMGRILVGHDNRLLLADIETQARALHDPDMVATLLSTLHPVVKQRFPDFADRATRDIAIQLGDQLFWICFRKARATSLPHSEHWYIELRPLDAEELQPVGLVPDERIAQAIAYLHENYHLSPSLAEVAHTVHISPFHFHRLFTRQVGISPKHYLQGKQLQVAKWLLRAGNTPIGTIAQKTGFSSHGHFTSTFHRLVGQSPTEYRETHG